MAISQGVIDCRLLATRAMATAARVPIVGISFFRKPWSQPLRQSWMSDLMELGNSPQIAELSAVTELFGRCPPASIPIR
jgi:hypothetical protein